MWLFVVRWKELMKRVDCESGSVEIRAPKDVDGNDDGLVRVLLLVKNAVVSCEAWVVKTETDSLKRHLRNPLSILQGQGDQSE